MHVHIVCVCGGGGGLLVCLSGFCSLMYMIICECVLGERGGGGLCVCVRGA